MLQDVVGVAAAIVLLSARRCGQPIDITLVGLVAFALLSLVGAYLLPRVLADLRSEPDLFLAVSVGDRPRGRRARAPCSRASRSPSPRSSRD